MKRMERKQHIRMPLSVYFSYLLVTTLLLTGVTFSKYTAEVSSSDSSKVAAFSFVPSQADDQSNTIVIDISENITYATYAFSITYKVDVTTDYTVMLNLPGSLSGVSIGMTENGAAMEISKISNTQYQCNGTRIQAGSSGIKDYVLTFTAQDSLDSDATLTGINIKVDAWQVD